MDHEDFAKFLGVGNIVVAFLRGVGGHLLSHCVPDIMIGNEFIDNGKRL
jgi:hypothetical protein